MPRAILKVALLSLALGLDALAVAIGIGLTAPDLRQTLRVVVAFALAAVALAAAGVLIGRVLGRAFAPATGVVAALLLVVLGILTLRGPGAGPSGAGLRLTSGIPLLAAALTVSLDALAVGIILPVLGAPVALSLITIAGVDVALTTVGLLFGRKLGRRAGPGAERLAGGLLALTGLFVLAQALG